MQATGGYSDQDSVGEWRVIFDRRDAERVIDVLPVSAAVILRGRVL
jgi:hypothetical protein